MKDLATSLERIADAGVSGITLHPPREPGAQRRARTRHFVAATAGLCLVIAAIGVALSLGNGGSHQPTFRGGSGLVADASYSEPSESMVPTLAVGDVVSAATEYGAIERGDVVHMSQPGATEEPTPAGASRVFKRVIGVPGDTVAGHDGAVFVDGRQLVEPYTSGVTSDFSNVVVPTGMYWVLGDNRANSRDSRVYGPVPASDIVAIALRITAPADRAGPIAGSPR